MKTLNESICAVAVDDIDMNQLKPGVNLRNDFGLDSLALVMLIIEIEYRFETPLDDSDFFNIDLNDYNSIYQLIESKKTNSVYKT